MDWDSLGGYALKNLGSANVILGKNGCGKSRLLRTIEPLLRSRGGFGRVRCLCPERGGQLQYDPGIDQNIYANENWFDEQRRRNQANQFRQQSTSQYRRLELLTLRAIEQDLEVRKDPSFKFDKLVDRLNVLLDRVEMKRSDPVFKLHDRETNQVSLPDALSSGENELVALGIECLVFDRECVAEKQNVLMIDEPDVHLHPDLQYRFASFVLDLMKDGRFTLIVATHSTAFLGALADQPESRVAFMRRKDTKLNFEPVSEAHRNILPIFGAHPLSNVFNKMPALLVEGESDERIWQQAVRSSNNSIRLYPCAVDGLPNLNEHEVKVDAIITSVYDDGVGFSLRDRDDNPEIINDLGNVRRMRLACRTAENLLLADEVLAEANTDWATVKMRIDDWVAVATAHTHHAGMKALVDGGYDRMGGDLKSIRNVLVHLFDTTKPWEVLVGRAIAKLVTTSSSNIGPTSLRTFLGPRVCCEILRLP